jgi:hypothetical protein
MVLKPFDPSGTIKGNENGLNRVQTFLHGKGWSLSRSAHGTAIERAVISITALRYVPTPPPAAQSDIWLRSWRWLNSLHECASQSPDSPNQGHLYLHFMAFITQVQMHWDAELIIASPGIRAVAGKAWALFVGGGDTAGLRRICDSLSHDVDSGDERVAWRQELARGLGGDLAALAPIFVHHLDLAAGNARFKLPVSTTRMSLVVTLVDFLVDTSVTTGLDEQYQEALMTHGIVRHPTAAICGLALNGKLKLGRWSPCPAPLGHRSSFAIRRIFPGWPSPGNHVVCPCC